MRRWTWRTRGLEERGLGLGQVSWAGVGEGEEWRGGSWVWEELMVLLNGCEGFGGVSRVVGGWGVLGWGAGKGEGVLRSPMAGRL